MPEATSKVGWATIWALGLGLGSLGGALIFLDASALERLSSVFDGKLVAWFTAVAGYFLIASSSELVLVRDAQIASRSLGLLALLAWTYRQLVLRWPWLIGSVTPKARRFVESAVLSRGFDSLPLLAFGTLLADAVLFTHATLYLIEAARLRGWLPDGAAPSRARGVLVGTALALYFVAAAVTVSQATGRY